MKKTYTLIVAISLLFLFCSCSNNTGYSGWNSSSEVLVKCPFCGEATNANANYCQICGNDLRTGPNQGPQSNGGDVVPGCSICADSGFNTCRGHECISCDGKGYIKCYGCVNGSTAYGPCPVCRGGKIDCACEKGVVYYTDNGNYYPGNSPAESEPCQQCENGYVECSLCEGTGKFGSYTVGGFDGTEGAEVSKTCSKCGGRKKLLCSYCGGDGEL